MCLFVRTVEVEGVADSSQDDSVGDLGEEVILEIGVVDHRCGGILCRNVAGSLKVDEFWYGNLLFETRKTAWREMQLLDEDRLVHQTVPVYAGFHVAFPRVEIHIVAGIGSDGGERWWQMAYLVNIDRQQVAARWIIAHESIGRRI